MPVTYANLLIVSDDPQSLATLRGDLRDLARYDATLVNSLAEVEKLALTRPFDVVLIDVRLKQCDPDTFFARWQERVPIPVIVMGRVEDIPLLTECVAKGAADYLLLPTNPTLLRARIQSHLQRKRLQEQALASLEAFNEVEKLADDLRLVILPLGISLSTERNFERLIERFVETAMELCNADAGSLFMRTDEEVLHYAVMRVSSLGIAYGGTSGAETPFEDLPLYDMEGAPVLENVATYTAHKGVPVNIADIYNEYEFDFSGTKEFDEQNDYRSVSCLTVPLRTRRVLGVLQLRNAINPESGQIEPFGAYQQLVAESLASQVAVALQNRRLRQREAALLRYKRELEIGRNIQASFFPDKLPQPPGWEVAARFHSAREVAGDFYDVFVAPHGRLAIAIADVCDKGVVAALFMALLRSLLRAYVQQHYYLANRGADVPAGRQLVELPPEISPDAQRSALNQLDSDVLLDAIRLTNAYIGSNHASTHIFATLFFGILDPQSGQMIYANCGHLPPVVCREDGSEQRLMPTGPAVGLLPDAKFAVEQVTLNTGDLLFAYTDGVTEARSPQGEMFGEARLAALRTEHAGQPAETLLAAIETALRDFMAGAEPSDDITMLAVRNEDR